MEKHNDELLEEKINLEKTTEVIRNEIEKDSNSLDAKKKVLIATRKHMWENTVHYTTDFEKLTEINQHLTEVTNQTADFGSVQIRLKKLKSMKDSPYFGRFDFIEDDTSEFEKIYIGLNNLVDSKTHTIFIYDWRAPISSVFYRFELGRARYKAPFEEVNGEVALKRQYKIQSSELKYFFDCSVKINDEILQDVLSRNSSPKMRNIVETIQKEQDKIIRDNENDLLIVQGVAGSGKTSIALHRVAFLLYEGLGSKLGHNNILILSPNKLFGKYIKDVLPELGEENVEQTTVEEVFNNCFGNGTLKEGRNKQLEDLILCKTDVNREFMTECMKFKGSRDFKKILDRMIWHYEHRVIQFKDIYYDGDVIEKKDVLKSWFLNDKIHTPMAMRLKKLESRILEKVQTLRKKRLERIEGIVQKSEGHEFEIKSFSRLLAMKENKVFLNGIREFIEVDPIELYKMLFADLDLFYKLAGDKELPQNINNIIDYTFNEIKEYGLKYEDAVPILYLKLRIEGSSQFSEIKQLVIDEAQDYYPMHFEIFKLLFRNARYTIMGDTGQTLEKEAGHSLYKEIIEILDKPKSVMITLDKSYRGSYEINRFSQRLLGNLQNFNSFERHEEEPKVICGKTDDELMNLLVVGIQECIGKGFESIGVICKNRMDAEELYMKIDEMVSCKLVIDDEGEIEKGVTIIPGYMSKGLEFDAVLVFGVDSVNYTSNFDRKLLYIACTRALHHLKLYYCGEKSKFLHKRV